MATPTTLPASFVAGNVLTADQLNNVRGAFRILQVVTATTATQASSTSATYADTGLTATITPSSTSSKILVVALPNGCGKVGNVYSLYRLVRGSTEISVIGPTLGNTQTTLTSIGFNVQAIYLDSPATTSATTYKLQFGSSGATSYVQTDGATSYIALLEVSA
jgi:hypothetical protein